MPYPAASWNDAGTAREFVRRVHGRAIQAAERLNLTDEESQQYVDDDTRASTSI